MPAQVCTFFREIILFFFSAEAVLSEIEAIAASIDNDTENENQGCIHLLNTCKYCENTLQVL